MHFPVLVLGLLYFIRALSFLIIVRIVLSWIAPRSHHPMVVLVIQITESVLQPIRDSLPRGNGTMAMIDWSPLIALIGLDLLRYVIIQWAW